MSTWISAQITVDPMAPVTLCGGQTLAVAFTAIGTFNAGNVFSVELSDAAGSFAAPTIIGSVLATGSGSTSCGFPAGIVGGAGQAIRVNASDPVQTGIAYILPMTTVIPPNAGSNAVITLCSSDPPTSLFAALGGTPQSGGTWTNPPGNPSPNTFIPGTSIPGCYTYTVASGPPCANDTAVVCVSVNQAIDLGTDGNLTVCSNASPIDLGAGLPAGGTWVFLGGPHSSVFTPGVDPPGCYTYTVPGIAPCSDATVDRCITVEVMPDAGLDAAVIWCISAGVVDLFTQLGGTPDPGGTWTDIDATGELVGSIFNAPAVAPGNYDFTYVVNGNAPCVPASATLTVTVAACIQAPPPQGNFATE
ncbi:MAG: hypothetical protein ABI432_12625 [Flavobacteriales bacterium]